MLKSKLLLSYALSLFMLLGCTQTNPTIDKHEQAQITEQETITSQKNIEPQPHTWVQPKNKSEACKIYVAVDPDNDKTLHDDYKLYWDGACKDGYAYNLGREIEKSRHGIIEQIGFYENGKAKDYCIVNNISNKTQEEGECVYEKSKSAYLTITLLREQEDDFEVIMNSGVGINDNTYPLMFSRIHLFHDIVEYWKAYPNFSHVTIDYSNNAADNRNYEYYIKDHKTGQKSGYAFVSYKSGEIVSGKIVNGELIEEKELSQDYFKKVNTMVKEIQDHAKQAMQAQKKATAIKIDYLGKICNANFEVDFMDNDEYKEICVREYQLGAKINAKLAQIKKQKQTQ
jgi:uncharacterized protein YcfL